MNLAQSWQSVVDWSEELLTLIALLGAIWSAVAFVRKLGEDREAARQARVNVWRKAKIQEIQHQSPEFLSVTDMTQKLRSSSFDASFDIKKEELSEQAVRLILLEMIRDGILFQVWGDKYGLQQQRFDPTAQMADVQAASYRYYRRAFELILKYPGHYTDDSLFDEVVGTEDFAKSDFILAISELVGRQLARKNEHGKWQPLPQANEENT